MKRLWLLLLPAGAGLVFWVSVAVDPLYFLMLPCMIALPFSLGFSVQGNVLAFSRQRLKWLRFVTLGLLLIPITGAVSEASWKGMLWQLAVAVWIAAAVLYLIGWGAAWALEAKDHA